MRQKFRHNARVRMHYVVVMFFAVLTTFPTLLFAQDSKTIKGTILSGQNNSPLSDVSVIIKGTGKGTKTGSGGEYSIVAKPSDVIVFSYLGFATREEKVGDQTTINVTLQVSTSNLDEVVVVGYGTSKRRDLTGSVASVTGKDIAATPVANVAQALQGKLAGVSVTSQDGRPGADISILVRGARSISQSNQPLILIDGVPGTLSDIPVDQVKSIDVLKDASSSAIYGARGANGVVLVTTKGAQSGKVTVSYSGYVKFNEPLKYMAALGPYDYLKYVWANAAANGAAYQTPFEKLYGLGANAGTNTGGIDAYKNLPIDDVQKMVYNNSTSYSHDLTITGGTDKTKVLFGINYIDDEGMKINSFAKRANALFKIVQKVYDNVTFGLDIRYTDLKSMDDEGTTNGYGSILSAAYNFRPISTPHILGDLTALKQGNIDLYGKGVMWDTYSPAARTADYFPLTLNQKLRGIASLDWRIIKNLTYHTDLTGSRSWVQQKYWSGAVYNTYLDETTGAKLFAGNADYRKNDGWYSRWSNTLNYQFDINDNHKLNLLAGQEVSNSGGTGMAIQANHFPANFDQQTAFAQINQYNQTVGSASFSSSVAIPDRLLSFFGRANYSFLDRYLLTATFRADGSSKFAPEHRWGYFPAGAIAWKASQEQFLKNVNWLDNLKLRASFGEVGNDGINSNLWSQSWGSVTDQRLQYAINGNRQSAYDLASATLANPNLKWETTITRDLGIDFGLFKNRFWGTIDVYKNTTKDLLMLTSIPGITGFTATYANIGQTSNKGIEISLSGAIIQNKDWTVNASGNINFNRSNVDKLAPNVTGLYGTNWGGVFTYPVNDYILQVGKPVGLVRGLIYDGFYKPSDFIFSNGKYTLDASKNVPDLGSWFTVVHGLTANDLPSTQHAYPGLPKFKDLNGDGKIDDNDLSVIGNMNPKFTGGANFSASYKGIDLGLYFNFSYGNQIYNANKLATLYGPKEQGVYQNKLAIMKDAYKIYDVVNGQLVRLITPDQLNAANANATLPLSYEEVQGNSTLGIEDGSFLRLNTLTLGYSLPKSLTAKAKITSVRVYGSIYNVFTITGYSGLDPEVNVDPTHNGAVYPTIGFDFGAYPRARSFVVGLNVTL